MPTFVHGKDSRVYAAGFDLTGYFNSASVSRSKDTSDSSVFNIDDKTYVTGQRDATFSGGGFFDGTTAGVDAHLAAAIASTAGYLISYMPAGDTTGISAYAVVDSIQTNYGITSPISGIVEIALDAQASGGSDRYIILRSLAAAEGSTGTGTTGATAVYNSGAAHTNGGYGILQVTAQTTGLTSLTVTLYSSTDSGMTSPTTHGSFTATTAAGVAERIAFSGTLKQYWWAGWTAIGASTDENATFHVGMNRQL